MVKRPTPRLEKLLARVRRLTIAHGAKSALAAKLGVPPQRLNEWLSGDVEPGGETTLHLLEWATAEEARKKRDRRPGCNPTDGEGPQRQIQNE